MLRDYRRGVLVTALVGIAGLLTGCAQESKPTTQAAAPKAAVSLDGATDANWATYHGSWRSFHFSALDQINSNTVQKLDVVWTHDPGRDTRGLRPRSYFNR